MATLGRLLRLLARSLPMYLRDARPYGAAGQAARAALARLVADAQTYAGRIAQAILGRGGQPDPGPFPTAYACLNDTDLDFILRRVIAGQRRDMAAARQCAADLASQPELQALAEETLGNMQAHLDELEGLERGQG
jgi:hypothetical protein